jgi:hypothetical protein
MAPRLELHDVLLDITPHVYFQPPNNIKLEYPCIVYQLETIRSEYADNRPLWHTKRYQVTVIDRNPDTELPDKVVELPMSEFSRAFMADNLFF